MFFIISKVHIYCYCLGNMKTHNLTTLIIRARNDMHIINHRLPKEYHHEPFLYLKYSSNFCNTWTLSNSYMWHKDCSDLLEVTTPLFQNQWADQVHILLFTTAQGFVVIMSFCSITIRPQWPPMGWNVFCQRCISRSCFTAIGLKVLKIRPGPKFDRYIAIKCLKIKRTKNFPLQSLKYMTKI